MNSPRPTLPLPKNVLWNLVVLALLVVAAAAFLLVGTARAQEEPQPGYVDLVVFHEYLTGGEQARVKYGVRNTGTATATGVIVSFRLDDLQVGDKFKSLYSPTTMGTTQSFSVEVGTLSPGDSVEVAKFNTTRLFIAPYSGTEVGVINVEASSFEPEPQFARANNSIKVYSFDTDGASSTYHMSLNRLALLLSVDDLRPVAGGAVNFGLTAKNNNGSSPDHRIELIADAVVMVELTEGLEFKEDWTPPTGFEKSDSRSAIWSPPDTDGKGGGTPVGNLHPDSGSVVIQTQLTAKILDEIPLQERCITAWVEDSIPPPNPDYSLGSLKQCLGDDPPVLFEEGSVAILTSFPCIDDTHTDAHQCESVPGVAVAARAPSRYTDYQESADFEANLRSHDVGRTDESASSKRRVVFLDPESVFIQVKDPDGRVRDTHTQSVSDISWQTARKAITGKNPAVEGVTITYTRKDVKDASAWSSLGPRTLTVTRADGTTPGKSENTPEQQRKPVL